MKPIIKRIVLAAIVTTSALSSSGCLISRIQTVQEQACDFDRNFEVSMDNGASITFQNPVLFYDDVELLAGIAPDLNKIEGNRYSAGYILKKVGDAEFANIPVKLEFTKQQQQLLLTRISVHTPLLASLHPIQLPQTSASACNTSLPLLSTRLEMPIPDFDRSIIPTRAQVIALLGRPVSPDAAANKLDYRFVLQGAEGEQLSASISLEFDHSGRTLLRTQTRFHHYLTGADFETGMAWGSFTL